MEITTKDTTKYNAPNQDLTSQYSSNFSSVVSPYQIEKLDQTQKYASEQLEPDEPVKKRRTFSIRAGILNQQKEVAGKKQFSDTSPLSQSLGAS